MNRRRPHPLVTELVIARRCLGLTQHNVADRMQVNRSLVGAWEAGMKIPELPNLIAYAHAVGWEITVVPAAEVELRRAS